MLKRLSSTIQDISVVNQAIALIKKSFNYCSSLCITKNPKKNTHIKSKLGLLYEVSYIDLIKLFLASGLTAIAQSYLPMTNSWLYQYSKKENESDATSELNNILYLYCLVKVSSYGVNKAHQYVIKKISIDLSGRKYVKEIANMSVVNLKEFNQAECRKKHTMVFTENHYYRKLISDSLNLSITILPLAYLLTFLPLDFKSSLILTTNLWLKIGFSKIAMKNTKKHEEIIKIMNSKCTAEINQLISGMETIMAENSLDSELFRINTIKGKLNEIEQSYAAYQAKEMLVSECISLFMSALFFYSHPLRSLTNNEISAALQIFHQSLNEVVEKLPTILQILNSNIEIAANPGNPTAFKQLTKINTFSLKNICFTRMDKSQEEKILIPKVILKKVNLEAKSGDILVILGQIGSGKSTLMRIIAGLIDPDSTLDGTVYYNKIDKRLILASDIKKRISISFQNKFLFNRTIRENLEYGASGEYVSNEKHLEYMKVTGLDKVLTKGGYTLNTEIANNGNEFSGGEGQLIALTRCLEKNADVYLLDEPTSNMDKNTSDYFVQHLKTHFKNKILIIISHDFSFTHFATRICFLETGQLKVGNHQELLAEQQSYYSMWNKFREEHAHSSKEYTTNNYTPLDISLKNHKIKNF